MREGSEPNAERREADRVQELKLNDTQESRSQENQIWLKNTK